MDTPKIFESEYRFCLILWDNEPVNSGKLVQLAKDGLGWTKATTYTVIRRLCERGVLKNENTIVTSLVSKEEAQKSRLEEHLGQAFGDPVKREGCFVSSPRKWRDFIPGRAGVYLCGEAAGFISASSFEGISSAILSGKLLAESFLSGQNAEEIIRQYRRKTLGLRLKLWCKIPKMRILCSPTLRSLIMRSGVQSVKRYR
jgi:predicted transcriptional regulator